MKLSAVNKLAQSPNGLEIMNAYARSVEKQRRLNRMIAFALALSALAFALSVAPAIVRALIGA